MNTQTATDRRIAAVRRFNRCYTRRIGVLEESLLQYSGALVLVTHDRYMLDRLSTVVLGLDGMGAAERFADYSQWEIWQRSQKSVAKEVASAAAPASVTSTRVASNKKKLSYKEQRELDSMEERIAEAEKALQTKHDLLLDPQVMNDAARLRQLSLEFEADQKTIDELYARWAELEKKQE